MRFVLMGAGGQASEVADLVRSLGHVVVACFDDFADAPARGIGEDVALVRSLDDLDCEAAALAVGDAAVLERFFEMASSRFEVPALVHPSAVVSPSASIGEGTVVMTHVSVNAGAQIGRGCIVNASACVAHHCVVGDWVHLAPGSRLGGEARVETGALCGAGCVVLPRTTVGARATCGAGAVVTADVATGVTVAGVPAKAIRGAGIGGVDAGDE